MTLTRSQRGVATQKPEMLGMVETPPARRTSQRGAAAETNSSSPSKSKSRRKTKEPSSASSEESDEEEAEGTIAVEQPKPSSSVRKGSARGRKSAVAKEANGSAHKSPKSPLAKEVNGSAHTTARSNKSTPAKSPTRTPARRSKAAPKDDHRVDLNPRYEFFGVPGVSLLMIGFPLLMYYMWIGATYYDGKLPIPAEGEHFVEFMGRLYGLAYEGAFPSLKAWAIYWTFTIVQAIFYVWLPGVTSYGQPLAHEGGRKLAYHCSGAYSFWTTLAISAALHASGLFSMTEWIDEVGPIMSVSIISGFAVSFIAYFSALWRGKQHRLTGRRIYDFFMGAELNPRIGILDMKMFVEVRIPWYILFLISVGTAARQWEQYGYVSGEVAFVMMAHLLYANACSKGEHFITPTWDMATEKWGFMLIFWNLAGVPLSYCHSDIYLANHDPATYRMHRGLLAALFVAYLFVYWVWDTTNSQKNFFRQQERGDTMFRKAFPILPWQTIDNPRIIRTTAGTNLLVDGWYGYARKIHYTCDLFFALSWGFICGFHSPFPWFYSVFFAVMIAHRAWRDIQRCSAKYGDAWQQYKEQVPYLFIPYVI